MKIAIIGFGPRGLSCLEQLIFALSKHITDMACSIYIFEPSKHLGTGSAWDLDQSQTNYINISDHALQNLKGREVLQWDAITIPSFPSYAQWCIDEDKVANFEAAKDIYPPRFQMGAYLHQRAKSIIQILQDQKLLTVISERVIGITYQGQLYLNTEQDQYVADECVLTIGHTKTKASEETTMFINHAKSNGLRYIHNPYTQDYIKDNMSGLQVAIKGYGLSMLDITRHVTNHKFGNFKEKDHSYYLTFVPEKGCVSKIIPYSHEGLPSMPKPFGRKVDDTFKPSILQTNKFELTLKNKLSKPEIIDNIDFVLDAFSEIAAEIFKYNNKTKVDISEVENITKQWLQDTSTVHALILDTTIKPIDYIKDAVAMAYGDKVPTLDYTIGQVWRHLQPTLYRLFAFSGIRPEVMAALVKQDHETKRYSYGPPVESLLQLIALHEAGILDLDMVNDPEITLVDGGWSLKKGATQITAQMLCNSVLASPVLNDLDDPLIKSLMDQKLIKAVHEKLGVLTYPDATVITSQSFAQKIKISVIGRNAKGNVLGTDAILECFSPEIADWAKGVVKRFC